MTQGFPFQDVFDELKSRLATVEASLIEQRAAAHSSQTLLTEIRQLVGPFAVPVSPEELLVQTLSGVKFYVPARDQIITPQLIVYRQWEPQLSRLLPHFAPAGSVFVDVGANFGYFTCLIAAGMRNTPGSRVIAVEPNPEMLRLLDINTRINWSMAPVRVVAAALADQSGLRSLSIPATSAGNATLAYIGEPTSVGGSSPGGQFVSIEVAVLRLDDILRDEPNVDLIKIDVEGFETAVLRGGLETIRRPGLKIVFEWALSQMNASGFQPETIIEILRQNGYRLFDAETYLDTPIPSELTNEILHATPYGNILAIRE
jgi:FkbM family methyltransferase